MIVFGHFIGMKLRWILFETPPSPYPLPPPSPTEKNTELSYNDSDIISLPFKQFDVEKDQYFKNIVQSYTYFNLKNYAKLGKPVDKERWVLEQRNILNVAC